VLLTAKEHFLCHKLLVLIYPKEKKLIYALWMMSNGSNKFRNEHLIVSSKDYENHRQLFIEAQKERLTGRVVNPEVGKKISKSKIGFKFSDKSKKKMSESQKGKTGEKNSFYGRKHTEDSKKKMSESAKKRKVTEETRKKMSKSRQGRKHTEESKKKMSENMKNIKRKTCVCNICQGIFSLSNINRHRNSCIIKNNVGDSH
jgi:predicted RND superfamily exporter protein